MFLIALLALAGAAPAEVPAEHRSVGTFEPEVKPVAGTDDVLAVTKRYHGALEGTANGKMVGVGDPASGTASYVVAETVSGTLDGHKGQFVLLHRGWMNAGKSAMMADIAPGSGTGDLAGISGRLSFEIVGKEHRYVLTYTLPK